MNKLENSATVFLYSLTGLVFIFTSAFIYSFIKGI